MLDGVLKSLIIILNTTPDSTRARKSMMDSASKEILVVVLNWNDLPNTIKCIDSIYSQEGAKFDVLLVDNNSTQFVAEDLLERFPSLNIIKLNQNRGVAGGRNVGLALAIDENYEYVMFFDNDAVAHKNMLAELIKVIREGRGIGIVGPKIYRNDALEVIWRAGCSSWRKMYLFSFFSIIKRIYHLAGRPLPLQFDFSRGDGYKDIGQYEKIMKIDFQIGCAQMLRTEAVRQVGLLDERFTPYGSEDIDYCARTQKAGWQIVYVPMAKCWHAVNSKPNRNPERIFHNLKNLIILARKHLDSKISTLFFLFDFILIHYPLVFLDNLVADRKAAYSTLKVLRWHFMDIKKNGYKIS